MAEPSGAQTASGSDDSSSPVDIVMSPAVRSPSSLAAPSSSFRKLRQLLMAKKFETYDNLPVGHDST